MPYDEYEDDPYATEEEATTPYGGGGLFSFLRAPEEEYAPGPMSMEDADLRYDSEIPENPTQGELDMGLDGGLGMPPEAMELPPEGMSELPPEGGAGPIETNTAVEQGIRETLQEKARLRQEATQKFRDQVKALNSGGY